MTKLDSKYIVVCSTYMNEDKTRTAYGIAIADDSDGVTIILKSYGDLTSDSSRIEELVHSCNLYKLDPIHLEDIIEDFLG